MSGFRTALDRIGGPGAVTWWAFGVSSVERMLASAVGPGQVGLPVGVRLLAVLVTEVAMFVPLVILRLTLLRDPARPRPLVAIGGFVVAAVVRGLTIDGLYVSWGDAEPVPWARVASGFYPTVATLIVTAYVVNTLRERRDEISAVAATRQTLAAARAEAEGMVRQENEEAVRRVRDVLERELSALSSDDPAAAASTLRHTATDVVRPLSHDLATSFVERESPAPGPVRTRIGWRDVLGDTAVGRPLRPLVTVAVLAGTWIVTAVVVPSARVVIVIDLVIVLLALLAGNAILRRVLPGRSPGTRVLLVVAVGIGCGVIAGAFALTAARLEGGSIGLGLAATFDVALMTIAIALISGVQAARQRLLDDLQRLTDELRVQVVRTQQVRWFHHRGLARALHGPVQTAVTAAAIRLDAAMRDGGEVDARVIQQVREELTDALDVLSRREGDAVTIEESFARLRGTWEGVCEVRTSVTDPAALADDPILRAFVVDITSEAVSNAVRHGGASVATVTVAGHPTSPREIRITVETDGRERQAPGGGGLGTRLLDECTLAWSRESAAGMARLVADLPSGG